MPNYALSAKSRLAQASSEKGSTRAYPLVIVLILGLGVLNIFFTNVLATKGIEFSQIVSQTQEIATGNRRLKNSLHQLTALSLIEQKSQALGFVRVNNTIAATPTLDLVAQVVE